MVATDAPEIADAVAAAGGRAVMTRSDHATGSDRIFEALGKADPEGRAKIVVNVQGDFPMLTGEDVRLALGPLADPAVDISTLVLEITDEAERTDPNAVKAICSPVSPGRFRALYFTRATAPSGEGPLYHHIGLYAYRRAALERFVALPPSPLEQRERLEQLRALEAGMRIDVALTQNPIFGVDTRRASGKGAGAGCAALTTQELASYGHRMSKLKIAFQGEPGANSDIAAREAYPGCEPMPCATFEDALPRSRAAKPTWA